MALYYRAIVNPFRYATPVDPDDLIDRGAELAQLLELALGGDNTRLIAPRRYGKTSLLRALARRAERRGMVPVYVNFFGSVTVAEIAERIELAFATQLRGPLGRWFDGVRATLRVGPARLPAAIELTDARAEQPLLERLALPRRLFDTHGKRCLIAFDEFQDTLTAHSRIGAVIRSEIEHHGAAAAYVFTGSQVGAMRELFSGGRAFYAQARAVDLGGLGAGDVAAHVERRFAATGREVGAALAPLLSFSEGHPQRAMLLAHVIWERTPAGGAAGELDWASALERVLRVEAADELRGLWSRLGAGQRRALLAISSGHPPYARATQRQVGGSRGGGMEHALRSLIDAGDLLENRGGATGYRLADPLLAHWIREGRTGS